VRPSSPLIILFERTHANNQIQRLWSNLSKIISNTFKKSYLFLYKGKKTIETTGTGSSLLGFKVKQQKNRFRSLGVKISLEKLEEALPCILHWNKNHYVVL
jgi:ATP-binding cassette subfamily B protein